MSRFVRQSKYRHVFGKEAKDEDAYVNTQLTRSAWDANYIRANNRFFAMCWRVAGGGAVGVVPLSQTGKLPQSGFPLVTGHKNHVLDVDWNPFNDFILATASEDAYVKIWSIPEAGLTENLTEPVQTLKGHRRKVGTVDFNPIADNVLATSSQDYTVKVWDIVKGEAIISLDGPKDLVQSQSWNYNGSQLACTCKDKKIRVGDPRSGSFETEFDGHQGVKASRCKYITNDFLLTTGFDKQSNRQFSLHDPRNPDKPVFKQNIDTSSGSLMPFYDFDTNMIWLAGKGDGNIRFYEYTGEDKLVYSLSEIKSSVPQRGGCFIPKTACNVSENEIARFLKVTEDKVIPVSMFVPRKSDLFQDDIFPDTASGCPEPTLSFEQWKGGENAEPKTVNLEAGFVPKEKSSEEPKFEKVEQDDGPKTLAEYKAAYEEQKNRITYLEAELHKLQLGS